MSDVFLNNVEGNNLFRPYTSGLSQHDPNIATIILTGMSSRADELDITKGKIKDYFNDISSSIKELKAIDNDASPIIKGETIPKLPKLGNDYFGVFNNFSLMSVSEARSQIVKVNVNFGDSWNAFFFGKRPKVYVFSGFFMDSKDYPYYEEFVRAYDNYLAGGKSIENKFRTYITYDGKINSGYILDLNTTIDSKEPYVKPFQFQMLIDNESFARINYKRNDIGSIMDTPGSNRELSNVHRIINYSQEPDMADVFIEQPITQAGSGFNDIG